jgi:hypothetical protein
MLQRPALSSRRHVAHIFSSVFPLQTVTRQLISRLCTRNKKENNWRHVSQPKTAVSAVIQSFDLNLNFTSLYFLLSFYILLFLFLPIFLFPSSRLPLLVWFVFFNRHQSPQWKQKPAHFPTLQSHESGVWTQNSWGLSRRGQPHGSPQWKQVGPCWRLSDL